MELLTVTLTGYKRFKAKTSLQTNGKLIALLGPNEAGKSSLLDAIAHLGHSNAITVDEQSRDVHHKNFRILGRFFLNDEELKAASLLGPRSMIVTKKANGERTFDFDPKAPNRDTSHRTALVSKLRKVVAGPKVAERLTEQEEGIGADVAALAEDLEEAGETLDPNVLGALRGIFSRLETALSGILCDDVNELHDYLRDAIELEAAPTPLDYAIESLRNRVPKFLIFDEKARDLASNYSISELRTAIPPALANLAEVAGLEFSELFDAIDAGQTSLVTTLERRASNTLSERFRSTWKQSGLDVALRVQADTLEVQIVNDQSEFTPFAERSDGLRQFVALQMFATRNHIDQPVLLIDEADQRLHYDAQADLVQMLARQQLAPKVIYTTHSAGCLPEDLGNGVRTIVPRDDDGSSSIVNRFWSRSEPGLTPLLIGMGASTMAFFPTRRAVMVEGPSDMLLYPTLFREALARESLGFQFVPGLSRIDKEQAMANGTGVLYLVDGDPGGKAIEAKLLSFGVASADIFSMRNKGGSALELEDFVLEERLIAAINAILAKWHPKVDPINSLESEAVTRMGKLERIFSDRTSVPLPKVDLAYGLIGFLDDNPNAKLLDPKRFNALESIAKSIFARFNSH